MARQLRRSPKKGFADSNPNSKKPRLTDMVDVFPFPKKKDDWLTLRLVGNVTSYAQHWIEILSEKKRKTKFPKQCLNWDPETESHDTTKKCPYCRWVTNLQISYYSNAIIRDLQERQPRKISRPSKEEDASGFKDKGSDSWTPVRAVRIPPTLAAKFKSRSNLNVRRNRKTGAKTAYDLSDPKYGIDVHVSFDPDAKGSAMYDVEKGDRSPLTEEEMDYLIYKLEGLMEPESVTAARKEIDRLRESGNLPDAEGDKDYATSDDEDGYDGDVDYDGEDGDLDGYDGDSGYDGEETAPKSSRSRKSSGKKKKDTEPEYEGDGYDGDEAGDYDGDGEYDGEGDYEGEEEEEEEKPAREPQSSRSKKKKEPEPEPEYEGDGYDGDEGYDGEDDPPFDPDPPKKSRSKSKARSSSRQKPKPKPAEDDYDGDDGPIDDLDDVDEPKEKSTRSSKRSSSRSKARSGTKTRSRRSSRR